MLIGSKCRSWTWHPLIHHLKPVWEIHLSLIRFDYKVFPCVVFESMLPNHWSCHPYVQELSIWNLYWVGHLQLSLHSVSAFPVSIVRLPHTLFHFQTLLLISCHWWGIHQGPPVTIFVLLTSAHYPKSRLRNYLVPWSLHASMASFLAFDSGFTSLTPDRKIPSDVRHQLIYSHSMDCTMVPWESLTSMVISLTLVNGFINDR